MEYSVPVTAVKGQASLEILNSSLKVPGAMPWSSLVSRAKVGRNSVMMPSTFTALAGALTQLLDPARNSS